MLNIIKNAAVLGGSAARSDAEKATKAQAQIDVFKGAAEDAKAGATPEAIAKGFVEGFVAGAKKAGKAINVDTVDSRSANYKTFAAAMAKKFGSQHGYDLLDDMLKATTKPNATTPAKVPGSVRDSMFRGTAWMLKQDGAIDSDDLIAAMKKPPITLAQALKALGTAAANYYTEMESADELDGCPAPVIAALKQIGQYAMTEPHTPRKPGKGVNWAAI